MDDLKLEGLYVDAVHAMPVDYDWTEHEWETEWESFEVPECSECGEPATYEAGEGWVCASDEEECENAGLSVAEEYGDGPMMSYYYPLPANIDDMTEAAQAIANLPLCLVRVDAEWGLALTGGGMDLSWEICEAYMRLGYLPPLHFADLPRMAGKPSGDVDRWVIAGCKKSAELAASWATRTAERLAELEADPIPA